MKFTIEKRDEKWLLLSAEGKTVGSFDTHEGAITKLSELVVEAAPEIAEEAKGPAFRAQFSEADEARDSGGLTRVWDENSIRLDRPSIPIMLLTKTPEFGGHGGAELCGVGTPRREGSLIIIEGNLDAGSDAGQEAARLVGEKVCNTHSPDFIDATYEEEVTKQDDDGFPLEYNLRFVDCMLGGITITPLQGFDSATIELVGEGSAETTETEEDDEEEDAVAAAGGPVAPPAEWFDDLKLDGPTPLTITDEGEVLGHGALKGMCHIGVAGKCVVAPDSPSGYQFFHTGAIRAAGCDCDIPVGVITMDTGHADLSADYRQAAAHYDNTGAAVADVVAGEDEHGIWVHGALRPDVTDEQVRALRAAALSGDWRPIGTGLELVAFLAVNVPGFPVPRARVASGKRVALVAAGAAPLAKQQEERNDPVMTRLAKLEGEMRDVKRITDNVRPVAASALRDSLSA